MAPSIAAEICEGESYTVGTTDYTTTGVWVTNLTSINGCDSIVTLDLTVHPVYAFDLVESICDGDTYTVGDSVYTTRGTWVTNLTTVNGCDSIITLDLTVYPVYDQAVVRRDLRRGKLCSRRFGLYDKWNISNLDGHGRRL